MDPPSRSSSQELCSGPAGLQGLVERRGGGMTFVCDRRGCRESFAEEVTFELGPKG